jgi:hypothetical protein
MNILSSCDAANKTQYARKTQDYIAVHIPILQECSSKSGEPILHREAPHIKKFFGG